jgi:hypothetical protein
MTWRLAIVYPGDREVRRLATPHNNRFAALFAAFAAQGVQALPVVYADEFVDAVRAQLLGVDAALVWVNPIEAGRSRAVLDQLLREVAAAGVRVSTHPDVILKLGTKDVLVDTRHLGWGSDCQRVDSLAELAAQLPERLQGGQARVLKQWRGHSGIGVWRVQALAGDDRPSLASRVRLRHAQRGSEEDIVLLEQAIARMAPYFAQGGHMVDQAWQARLSEGMLRCYLVQDRVVGFGVQAVNALVPADDASASPPQPGPRLYHPPDLVLGQDLRQRLQTDWVPALQRELGITHECLPLLWDCDFLRGDHAPHEPERWVLCEINVSSVAPFPDSATLPLVQATIGQMRAGRGAAGR